MGQCHAPAMEPDDTRSHLDFVPDAVLCLIMHGLQCEEIARLSRCNRQLTNAANCEFAWSRATYELNMHALAGKSFRYDYMTLDGWKPALMFDAAPPKHAPLRLSWRPELGGVSDQQLDTFLWTLSRIGGGRIREFDASHAHSVRTKQFEQILAHPALQRVRCLKLFDRKHKGDYSKEMLRLLTLMPELHTLALWSHLGRTDDDFALLGDIPALTSLGICDSGLDVGLSRLMCGVATCRSLRYLHIYVASLYSSRWSEFCCSPNLASLESLHLQFFCADFLGADVPSAHVWRTGFAALKRLTRLHVNAFQGLDHMLLYTVAAPALRTIEVQTVANEQLIEMHMPTPATITSLLEAAPAVQLLLRVDCRFMPPRDDDRWIIADLRLQLQDISGFGFSADSRLQLIVSLNERHTFET